MADVRQAVVKSQSGLLDEGESVVAAALAAAIVAVRPPPPR